VDVDRAAKLYAGGMTLAEVANDLGVNPNTVRRHLLLAGVAMRPRGARAPKAPAVPPQPRRYPNRAQGRPWRQIFIDALAEQPVISVRLTVSSYLRRTPTRAETNAARRAAHSLAADGLATVLRVKPLDAGMGSSNLILARPGTSKWSRLLDQFAAGTADLDRRFDPRAIATDLARSVELLAAAVEAIPIEQLDQATAHRLTASVDASLKDLRRVRRQLRYRSQQVTVEAHEGAGAARGVDGP